MSQSRFNIHGIFVILFIFAYYIQGTWALINNGPHLNPMGRLVTGLSELQQKCNTPEKRRTLLEDIVIDNKRVSWLECEQCFAFSLKNDDRDWVLGLMDSTLKKVLTGYFHTPTASTSRDALTLEFANEIKDSLAILSVGDASNFDDISTSLMIARARERVEDDLYEQGIDVDGDKDDGEDKDGEGDISGSVGKSNTLFVFGDEAMGISSDNDKARREAIFKALCALRFVRLGLSI